MPNYHLAFWKSTENPIPKITINSSKTQGENTDAKKNGGFCLDRASVL